MSLLSVYPISSTACERGFSQMNLQQTSLRNSLQVETLSSLMLMISVNGPPLEHWSPRRYALSWLKTGHRSALDKLFGVARKPRELSSHELFLWLYTDNATLAGLSVFGAMQTAQCKRRNANGAMQMAQCKRRNANGATQTSNMVKIFLLRGMKWMPKFNFCKPINYMSRNQPTLSEDIVDFLFRSQIQ